MSKFRIRYLYYGLVEKLRRLAGRSDSLVPPRRLIDSVGGGDFETIGREFFGYFTGVGGLKPADHVLDVGCGCGRMAVPLIPYLSDRGEYWGFDIVQSGIAWCQKHIAARDRRFHFQVADIYNTAYNPKGRSQPREYRFPYEEGFFDFAFLTSVFTHMLPPDMEHYLAEISRVLRPGARCMITFFILNGESRQLIRNGASRFAFKHQLQNCWTDSLKKPEAAIAYNEEFVRKTYATFPLQIVAPILYGSWCGREQFLSFQDIILATKIKSS